MSFKVVIDSCGELTDEMKASGCFETASLMIQVDDHNIVDDATFDQADFLRRVAASPNCPKSSCPSPEAYRAAFDCDADHVFAVTLSSKLSGSYNSAVLGMNLLKEEKPDAKVYIFDSRSASIGETLIGLKIQECEEQGLPFEEIIDKVEAYIDSQMTWFVLENLETLRKKRSLKQSESLCGNGPSDQTGDGIHAGGRDRPAGSGQRHEQSPGSYGGQHCGESGKPG